MLCVLCQLRIQSGCFVVLEINVYLKSFEMLWGSFVVPFKTALILRLLGL